MTIDPVVAIVLIVVVAIALYAGKTLLANQTAKRDMRQVETNRREERAHQERLEKERMARVDEARQEEAGAMEAARKSMAFAQQEMHEVKESFHAYHDQLIEDIHLQAKAGCDAIFRNRFGITRPPKAENPQDDAEVQEYLRNHYAELRDAALARTIEDLMAEEVDKRIATWQADADGQEEAAAPELEAEAEAPAEAASEANGEGEANAESEAKTPSEGEPEAEAEAEAEAEGEAEPEADAETESKTEAEPEADAETESKTEAEPEADTPNDEPDALDQAESEAASAAAAEDPDEAPEEEPGVDRASLKEAVREEFDLDSIRTYLLAAISARYDDNGRPIGDLPWPAYTSISPRGFGELVLAQGAPVYAQDAYREFAWKKFHTGRRAEKPRRGEYSWPASHELGDGVAVDELPTPAGSFTAMGPNGPLPLYELVGCTWMRRSLEYKDALLLPDVQRSFFIKLQDLHKDETVQLRFDGPDFLEEAEDGPFFLNALGEVNGAYVGISASKPEAANLGEAPYELTERTPTGFTFRMTHDARRYDRDTYPQFLEVHLAWCQPPSPRPDRIIRHVAN